MKNLPTSMKEPMKVRPVSMKTPTVSMKALLETVIQSPTSHLVDSVTVTQELTWGGH